MPVTSIIEFGRIGDSTPVNARLSLINPRKRDTVEIGDERFSLASNFSAPLLSYGRLNETWPELPRDRRSVLNLQAIWMQRSRSHNRVVWIAIGILAVLQLVFVYAPFMNLWFHSAPIAARDWLLPIGIGFVIFLAVETEKALLRKLKS